MGYSRLTVRALGCLMLALLVLGGCAAQPLTGKVGTPLEHQVKVIAKHGSLHRDLRVTDLSAKRTNGNLLEVKVALENVHLFKDDIWCDIQVVFYDADKFELERTNWQPLFLSNSQVTYYRTSSLSSRANDYTIFLDKPRKSRN